MRGEAVTPNGRLPQDDPVEADDLAVVLEDPDLVLGDRARRDFGAFGGAYRISRGDG
jgi:hypothetical protein